MYREDGFEKGEICKDILEQNKGIERAHGN
jgi:hypothetical protein